MWMGHKETGVFRFVKSSRLSAKIAAYLVSIVQLLCLAFLYGWHFLNKISQAWPLTLTTQPSTSKLSDNPVCFQSGKKLRHRTERVQVTNIKINKMATL